jgi:hypothetical protein
MRIQTAAFLLCLAGCATGNPDAYVRESTRADAGGPLTPGGAPMLNLAAVADSSQGPPRQSGEPQWRPGQALMQGFFGVSFYDKVSRSGGSFPSVDGQRGDLDQMPMLGGGGQWKMGGDKIDWGFEGFMSVEGRANAAAFVVGGGGAAVAVDVDLLIIDLYGGPFVSTFLGNKLRLYGSVGPLIGFAFYDQSNLSNDGTGFGVGGYARTGLEFILGSHMLTGVAVQWAKTRYDMNSSLGDLEVDGFQVMLTFTTGL